MAADPPTGQEAKPLGVRQDLCALGGAKGIYRQGPTGPGLRHANQDSTDCEEKANIEVQSIRMTPAPGGPPPLSEAEFWRDYDLIRDDVNAAMLSCYTHRTINHIAATDMGVWAKMNRNPEFWQVTAYSLQNALFIVLARILDHDGTLHSVHKVLNATIAHPEFFSKAARRARKLSIPGSGLDPALLDQYDQDTWEPTAQDLRTLKKDLKPYKARFDAIYRPIRDQIAHIILKDPALVADLYSKTQKTDIDAILCFLHSLVKAIWCGFRGMPISVPN